MHGVLNNPAQWILTSAAANGATGTAIDCRQASNFALLLYECSGNSAIFALQVAPDGVRYSTVLTMTGTVGQTALLQVSAYYPYVRASAISVFSAAGGSARVNMFYAPGLRG